MAAELGISGVHGTESQDVCFLQNTDVGSFLAQSTSAANTAGPVVTLDGKEIGVHGGIHHFTVGQRKGLGIPDATPYYVVALDPAENAVVVGKKEDLYQHELSVGDVNWTSGKEPDLPSDFFTKIRYRHQGASARVTFPHKGIYNVSFQKPQMAITPGQFAVFYNDDVVMGGGVIV